MHILLFNFFRKPNPDYSNMAQGFRQRGHTVWLANLNEENKLAWHDGEKVVAETVGPNPVGSISSRVPIIRTLVWRLNFIACLLRLRRFIQSSGADIVQLNPGGMPYLWILPLFKQPKTRFIYDIRHINRGIRAGFFGRMSEELLIVSQRITGRYFFDRACLNHEFTARAIFGKQWPKWANVVPVGIRSDFLKVEPYAGPVEDPSASISFIYVGAITKFRELEFLFEAISRVREQTDRFCVRLVGPDLADGYYQQLIKDMGIVSVVQIDPPIPNDAVPSMMAGHHVGLAYTPDRKTWDYQPTIKVLEYRALGLPILSMDVVTHREVVEEGINGLLVQHTIESLSSGLLKFIMDRDFLAGCIKNARQMRKAVTMEDVAQMYEQDVYEPLMKG